jgi:hypothetical protein
MRRRALMGALLLIALGVALGATVFRTDIAQATGLAKEPIPVIVQNTPLPVHEQGTVAVRSADEEVSVTRTVQAGGTLCPINGIYTVPAGKELVVEYISAEIEGSAATAAFGRFFSPSGGVLPLVLSRQTAGIFTASEAVHYVFLAGAILGFLGGLDAGTSCFASVSVGGYLQPTS